MPATVHRMKFEKETLKKVTIFEDRAELKRELVVDLVPGLNEIVIENVSGSVNDGSVRVTGKGAAVIEEVLVANRRVMEGDSDSERAKELRAERDEITKKKRRIDNEKISLTKRIEALDKMIGEIGSGVASPKKPKFTADQETLDSISAYFDYYDKQVTELRDQLGVKEESSQRAQMLINVKTTELSRIEGGSYMKVISITLDSAEGGKVELELTYQVSGAKWHALYDIRVDAKEDKTTMQLSYFANVCQTTGEDWEGAQLNLSTARPCLGGNLPYLGTLDVSFYRPPQVYHSGGGLFGGAAVTATGFAFGAAPASTTTSTALFAAPQSAPPAPPMVDRVVEVSQQALSTEFAITRPCSIPSDGSNHKVTIGIIALEPKLVHESVPSKNASAFLTASAVNSSALPLLAGQASIFLDGAFVAKTQLKAVSPGESFTASLGVDPAVKIEYKPAHKYHEEAGLINKWSCSVTEQKIVVKNTRDDTIFLSIREQIPRSTDEKIVVKIISPADVEKGTEEQQVNGDHASKAGAKLLPSNILEWTVKLEKGENQTLLVKYSIEHPTTEGFNGQKIRLEFAERFGQ